MASGFWYLKDGRGFARRIQIMITILKEIHLKLGMIKGAEKFADYLSQYIPTEEHELNGYGGFYHKETSESIMMTIDFREFTNENQSHFWKAAQLVMNKLIKEEDENKKVLVLLLKELLDMNKRANKGENPMELNHLRVVIPPTGLRKGPGWENEKEN